MKTGILTILGISFSLISSAVLAADLGDELNSEVNALYDTVETQQKARTRVAAQRVQVQNEPIIEIREKAKPTTAQVIVIPEARVQKQSPSVVQDTPLKASRASNMRKKRVEIEQQIENKIVEQLEEERIASEQERADKMLRRLEKNKAKEAEKTASAITYPPARPMKAVQAMEREIVEIKPARSTRQVAQDDLGKMSIYVSGLGGMSDYPGASNVSGIYSAGATVGAIFPEQFMLEGSIIFSSFDIEKQYYYSPMTYTSKMDQTNITLGAKYRFLEGRIRPVVGVLVGYTHRKYNDQYDYYAAQSSNAFDAGLVAGTDLRLSRSFSIGADLRYMFNLSFRADDNQDEYNMYNNYNNYNNYNMYYPQSQNNDSNPIEEMSYYTFSVNAKFQF